MAMLPVSSLALLLVFGMLCVRSSIAASPPEVSSPAPAPAPENGYDSISLTPASVPAPSPAESIALSPGINAERYYDVVSPTPTPVPAPSPSPESGDVYPPSPSPGDLASPSPSPSPVNAKAPSGHSSLPPTPAPAPGPDTQVASDVTHDSADSDNGMSGGKKVGIAFGVVSGACLVGLAAKVYKKRQENIRRAQFGYYGDGDML